MVYTKEYYICFYGLYPFPRSMLLQNTKIRVEQIKPLILQQEILKSYIVNFFGFHRRSKLIQIFMP